MSAKNKKITEKQVEAIYNESQRKIATDPAYAEAFGRLMNSCRKLMDENGLDDLDNEQFNKALADLMLIDFCQKFGVDPADLSEHP